MLYAAVIRPVIDRVHVSLRAGARAEVRDLYARRGLTPGLEIDVFAALLDHPVPEAALAARMAYWPFDPEAAEAPGLVERIDGYWHLTEAGRAITLEADRVFAATAERLWSYRPSPSMPGLAAVEAVLPLVQRLLEAGKATGGPVFEALTPVWEPVGASPSALLASRLEALRHHRADAHRAAWGAAGLTVEQIQALEPGPEREAIEAETNRLDAPIYEALDADERLVLLGGLGALADGLSDR
ncbi:hypothetical protein O1R50_10920 [Glycomyces luteolus]|uniref:Uncharacterized protein n=1 Tax=Glycomyces luteolus TaxID=2670330 RepID=A0A9X3P7F4_9ACTN|nr:hypothetical protein [Glycomyces luteolus]MDA1360141.1 hypothetical protein [Glycomyces luteolus]